MSSAQLHKPGSEAFYQQSRQRRVYIDTKYNRATENSLEVILNFDRSQLANGGPCQDRFYRLSSSSSYKRPQGPGEVLKVEDVTDPTPYNIPAKASLSCIIYSTTNQNGTLVPASACVLWTYTVKEFSTQLNRQSKAKAPAVLWTHGTSGAYADSAPSAHRSLFYGELVPFTLAQAGYAVIAPDYAGLGVQTSWDGSFIPHQYKGSRSRKIALNLR